MSQQEIYDVLKKGGRWSARQIIKELPHITAAASIYRGLKYLRKSGLVKYEAVIPKGKKQTPFLEYWIDDSEEEEEEQPKLDDENYKDIHRNKIFDELIWAFHNFCKRFEADLSKIDREITHFKRMQDLFKRKYSQELEEKAYYIQDVKKVSEKLSKLVKSI